MHTHLSKEEIEAIACRVVQLMGERLSLLPAPPDAQIQGPKSDHALPQIPTRLAYTKKELCAELGLGPTTIWRLEVRGLLKSIPDIRRKLYSRSEVDRLLAGKTGKWGRANGLISG